MDPELNMLNYDSLIKIIVKIAEAYKTSQNEDERFYWSCLNNQATKELDRRMAQGFDKEEIS